MKNLWRYLKLGWQVFGRTKALDNPESARAWFQGVSAALRPYVQGTNNQIDDKALDTLDKILTSPELFAFFYDLVVTYFDYNEEESDQEVSL